MTARPLILTYSPLSELWTHSQWPMNSWLDSTKSNTK